MENKSSCFISYCHHDINRDAINFLVETLRKNTEKTTDYLYDVEIGIGKRFENFMSLLDTVDLVLMVCTPKYKEKAVLGKENGGGVGYEYDLIKNRYETILSEKREKDEASISTTKSNHFEVLPIVLKGNYFDSIPIEFLGNKALDLTYYRTTQRKDRQGNTIKKTPKQIYNRFEEDITRIVTTLRTYHTHKTKSYKDELQKTYQSIKLDMLFRDTKADFNNPKYQENNYEDTLFVRTHVYKQIEAQAAYLLIGRKGSGKSAITQVLPIRSTQFNSPYLDVVDIYANRDINFNILYSFLNREFVSDTKHVFDRLKCFRYGWALFFRICLMDLIVRKERSEPLSKEKNQRIRRIQRFINTINRNKSEGEDGTKVHYFTFSFSSVQRFMNYCIQEARKDEAYFLSDIDSKFNASGYFDFIIGKQLSIELESYLSNLPKKFLITFDGFDTEIEKFREQGQFFENDNLIEKVKFEIDWLHSLLLLVNDIKQLKTGKDVLEEKLDFCITIPNHRYLEILRNDIDSYRFQHRRKNLIWSGPELLIFLRKRLQVLANTPKLSKFSPWDTYDEILKDKFPYIPDRIEFEFNGEKIKIDLFLYVLRHTFWRPRDILLYYAHIISLCNDSRKNGHPISTEAIRISVANLTFEIIKDDFKNEFKGTIRNLSAILECFNRAKQVLTFAEIDRLIYNIEFDFVVSPQEFRTDIIQKVKFLYQIGFLGILANAEIKERFNLFSNHVFVFNEGCKPFKKVNREKLKDYQFIIHPIFCEYLELNTKENGFISYYIRQYILDLEGFMKASNEDFECE